MCSIVGSERQGIKRYREVQVTIKAIRWLSLGSERTFLCDKEARENAPCARARGCEVNNSWVLRASAW